MSNRGFSDTDIRHGDHSISFVSTRGTGTPTVRELPSTAGMASERTISDTCDTNADASSGPGKIPDQNSLMSYRTEITRQIEHGLPDKRMLDYARSITKASRKARPSEEARLKRFEVDDRPCATLDLAETISALTESTATPESHPEPQDLLDPMDLTTRPKEHYVSKDRKRKTRSYNRTDQPEECKVLHGAALTSTTHALSAPADVGSSRFAEHQREQSYFSLHHKPARPPSPRVNSDPKVPVLDKEKRKRSKNAPSPISLSAVRFKDPALVTSNEEALAERKQQSYLRRMFSSLLTPRSESDICHHMSRPTMSDPPSTAIDYFTQAKPTSPRLQNLSRPCMYRASAYSKGECIRISSSPEVKLHHNGLKGKDDVDACVSPVAASNSYKHSEQGLLSTLNRDRFDKMAYKRGVARITGPLSDSLASARPTLDGDSLTSDWFRQRIDEILGDDDDETFAMTLDWGIPLHLPNSPLCPLNPKYQGHQQGFCAYHGRKRSHPDASVEKKLGYEATEKERRDSVNCGENTL